MNSDISKRFIECVRQLKEDKTVRSSRQFAISLDFAPQSLSDIVNGKREVTIELIRKAIDIYGFNPLFIFSGEGDHFLNEEKVQNPILSITCDPQGKERIVYVPISAQAGYSDQLYDREFMEELPHFSLPGEMFQHGSFRCFDIKGDSMEPTLYARDKVVCSFVEKSYWVHSIADHHVYVLVCEGGVIIKRLVNNISGDGSILCISDNKYYEPYEMSIDSVKEIWKVEVTLSNFMHSPDHIRNGFQEKVDHLKTIIEKQSEQIRELNRTMELLIKTKRVGM